jgi:hypothetical protein
MDCHLSFDPLGHSAPLNTLHYVRLGYPTSTYPSKVSPTLTAATSFLAFPAVMGNNNKEGIPHLCMAVPPIQASSTPSKNINMGILSTHLKDLADAVHCLILPPQQPRQSSSTPLPLNPDVKSSLLTLQPPPTNLSLVFSPWRKPPRKVSYKRTFGAPDQGQMLDV